jgi:hypothetical protein
MLKIFNEFVGNVLEFSHALDPGFSFSFHEPHTALQWRAG